MWTVLKSPFAHKTAQENFERRIHKRAIKAWDADMEVINRWVWFLRKHRMHEVGMRITRWERVPVGVGKLLEGVKAKKAGNPTEKAQKMANDIIERDLMARAGREGAQDVAVTSAPS
jgi:small subunit ribosomal protein S10